MVADESQRKPAIPFLPLMLLIFMLMNFKPLIKLLLFVPQGEDISFFSFLEEQTYFLFPSSPIHQRNQKS